MKQGTFTVAENKKIASDIYRMVLTGDTSAISRPGQFVNVRLDGFFLRRPLSVCDWDEDAITLIYKALGHGTKMMTRLTAGAELNVLTGLGNGYDLARSGEMPLLVGGGVGIPPLYGLAKRLRAQGKNVTAVLGFNRAEETFLTDGFRALGVRTIVLTADGSAGERGLVTDGMALAGDYTHLYTCGPEPMLRAVYALCRTSGQFSFEERMGCGFGACMGCTCRTKYGSKRICKDGPVLCYEEVVW